MSRNASDAPTRRSDVTVALSLLELTPCETDLLSRVGITGSASTKADQRSEWSSAELSGAADDLAHFGLIARVGETTVVPGEDIPLAATRKAQHDDVAQALRTSAEREELHAAIMSRHDVPLQRLGASGDIEREFLQLTATHKVMVHAYPAHLFEWPTMDEDTARALQDVAGARRGTTMRDIVSRQRLRNSAERQFFDGCNRLPHCSVGLVDDVPLRLTLLDDSVAVIPLDPHSSPRAGAWIVRDREAVSFVGLQLAILLARAQPMDVRSDAMEFTARETVIVEMLAAGLTDEAIARRLGVADRTIRRIVAQLLKRVGAESRFGLAIECARNGLL